MGIQWEATLHYKSFSKVETKCVVFFISDSSGRYMVTNISDIAKLAGVSVSTVSRVLNNYKYVASDKREAVLKVIEEMNYTPNKNAIDLIRGETRTIGVILPYNNNPAFDQILNGILNKALENDFLITVLPSNYSKEKEVEYLQKLKSKL